MSAEGAPIELLQRRVVLPAAGRTLSCERLTVAGERAPHRHAFVEIVLVAGGAGVHVTAAGERPLARGDALAIGGTEWHAYRVAEQLEVCNVYLARELLARELAWIADDPLLRVLRAPSGGLAGGLLDARLAPDELDRCLALADGFAALARPTRARETATALLLLEALAAARVAHEAEGGEPLRPPPPAVSEAIALLRERFDEPWTLERLAQAVHLDRSHLTRGVRAHAGMPPMALLAQLRAEKAAALLLATDATVSSVGAAVGWADPVHFARRFRAHWGVSPSAYRRGER